MISRGLQIAWREPSSAPTITDCVRGFIVVGICTIVALLFRDRFALPPFAMLYLLGGVVSAMRYRRVAAILNAILSVTAFNYFCVPFQTASLWKTQLRPHTGRHAGSNAGHQYSIAPGNGLPTR